MKKRDLKFLVFILPLVFTVLSCTPQNSSSGGYDGREFDISENKDGSLIAKSVKEGNNYTLTITGQGRAKDYTRKEEVPWNPIVKRITSVTINEGITHIGDYSFISLVQDYLVLPSTVNSVGENTFNPTSIIYTYGGELSNIDNEVYYYSETKPSEYNKYFYMEDGIPHIWAYTRILFIGNSFTYFRGSAENPAVPSYFKQIAASLNQEVEIDHVIKGGHSLSGHSNPSDECGALVEQKLTTKQYDYVILQEHSTTPVNNYNTFNTAVGKLKLRIDQTQQDCKTILYQTWGFESYINDYDKYDTVQEMEAALRKAYEDAADENACGIHYVGKAFTKAYTDHKDIPIYHTDNKHQSSLGAYLSAAVHVKSIFNVNVTKCTNYCSIWEHSDYENLANAQEQITTWCKTLLEVANNN